MTVKKPLTGEKRKPQRKRVNRPLTGEKRKSERKKVKKPLSHKIPVVKPNIITAKWKRHVQKNPEEGLKILTASPRTQYVSLFLTKELIGGTECHPRIKNQYGEMKHAGIYYIRNAYGRSYITCNYEGVTMQRPGLPPLVDSSCAEHIKDCLINSTLTVLYLNIILPPNIGHANLLMIQKILNKRLNRHEYFIYRIEPHGGFYYTQDHINLDLSITNEIITFMKNVVFENEPNKPQFHYVSPRITCPSKNFLLRGKQEYTGVQHLEDAKYKQKIDDTGFCSFWSFWIKLIALYNRKSGKHSANAHKTAYRYLKQKNGPEQRMNFIRNFAKLLRLIEFDSMGKDEKGIEKVVKKYKDYIKTESLIFV